MSDEPLVHAAPLEALLAIGVRSGENALLVAATAQLATLLGGRASGLVVEGPDVYVMHATYGLPHARWPIDLARYPELRKALEERRVVAVHDVSAEPLLASVRSLLPKHLHAIAVVPLATDRCLGALMVQSSRPCAWTDELLRTAELIGRVAASMIEASRVLGDRDRAAGPPGDAAALAPAPPRGEGASSSVDRDGSTAGRLLLVDDDREYADTMKMTLEDEGYVVDVAASSAEGLAHARANVPQLILMDVQMPGGDGFSLAESLSEDPATRDIPILFLSGADDLLLRMRREHQGTIDFLAKPFPWAELLARVDRLSSRRALRDRMREAAHVDELTGLHNLRFFRERLQLEQARWQRYRTPVAIAMIDMDGLKRINDRFGHEEGSRAIAALGKLLRDGTRETDISVRYGGDEFVVLMPHATLAEGMAFAERTLARLASIRTPDGGRLAASIGVASSATAGVDTLLELLGKADEAAYRAKHAGGNRAAAAELPR